MVFMSHRDSHIYPCDSNDKIDKYTQAWPLIYGS